MSIDISNVYPNQDLKVDLKTRQPPLFVGDGSATFPTTSDYAQTAASADLALGETYTLCAWVRSVKPDGANHAVNIGESGTIKVSIAFYGSVSNPAVYCYNGVTGMDTTGFFESDPHTWYHIAMVIKPGAGNSQIFINGIESTKPHSVSFPLSGSPVLHIGGQYSASPTGDWQGDLANVALFTSSLTEDQVRQAMRAWDYASHATIATLEAFYPLSTNFNDSTGNHNATASGSPQIRPNRPQLPRGLDFSPGRSGFARSHTGRAVDFDGSADRITAAHYNPSGDYLTTTAWVNADTLRAQGLIHNGDTGRNSFLFYMGSASGNLLFYWNDTTGDAAITHQTNLVAGRWYHLAAVMDMSDSADHQVTYYIDGIAATGTRTSAAWFGDNSYQFGNQYATAGWFDGKIADCRIYDVALTQTQIRELYKNPEQVLPTGVSASNLRRYYPLSDYSDTSGTGGRFFQDMGADGEPAEDLGSALMAFGQSVPCPQLGLQQSATRHFFTGASSQSWQATVTAPGTTATLSGWIFWGDSSRTSYLAAIAQVIDAADSFNIRVNTSGDVTMYKVSQIDSGLNVNEGEWNHIVVTTKSTSPYWRCWVNGVEAPSPAVAPVTNITTGFAYPGSNSTPFPLNGFINDVAFWNTELDTPDVAALYNSGVQGMDVSTVQSANLKGWWKADDLTTFKDYSGNGADAVPFGSPGTIIGASFPENASGSTIVGDFSMKRKGDSVFNFTGGGDSRLELAANPDILPAVSGGYTFSAFVRLQTTGSDQAIMMSSATGVDEWGTYYNSSNNKYYVVMSNGSSNISDRAFTNTVTDNEWHHIAWTLDLSQEPAVGETYLDGVSDTSFTRTGMNTPPATSSFGIGYDPGNSNKEAFAAISSLKIYQRVLSADEIKSVYLSDERMIRGNKNE